MLTFVHCEFDALCHHFNKAFMYVFRALMLFVG